MNKRSLSAALLGVALLAATSACDAGPADAQPRSRAGSNVAATDAAAPSDSARDALLRRADLGRIKGSDSASTWLIVVSDFQCPYCRLWHREVGPRIERDYVRTGKIRIAYLNMPISTHRNAWPAHELAMCAAEQDRFWPVADALFETQDDWKRRTDARAYFDSLAGALAAPHGIDLARLRACIDDGDLRALIKADHDRSTRLGIGSTPSFFIGDRVMVGAQPYEAFAAALDTALAAARATRGK